MYYSKQSLYRVLDKNFTDEELQKMIDEGWCINKVHNQEQGHHFQLGKVDSMDKFESNDEVHKFVWEGGQREGTLKHKVISFLKEFAPDEFDNVVDAIMGDRVYILNLDSQSGEEEDEEHTFKSSRALRSFLKKSWVLQVM